MPGDRSPDYAHLSPGRQSLWNSLMGLAVIAALVGIAGLFLPIIPAGIPLVVAAIAWFGARRAAMERLGVLDWVILVLGVAIVAASFL